MPLQIRPARASDLDVLMAIEDTCFDADRLSRTGYRRLLKQASAVLLVAEEGNEIHGSAIVLFRALSRKARLYSIAARPGTSGIGRALLAAAENTARSRGAASMRLEVREDNARAVRLYEQAGYILFGRKADYYAGGVTALRFEKILD
jgi:[ribosomal protein S18]-alanine N-acetyltransferase